MKKLKAKNDKNNLKSITALRWLSLTSSINIIIMILMCIIIHLSDSDINSGYFIILTIQCIALFITGYMTGKKFRKNGLLNGILYNGPYILIVLIISLLLTRLKFDSRMVVSVLFMLTTSAIGGIVSVNSRKKR